MIQIIVFILFCYFALWAYTVSSVIRVQKALFKNYPEKSELYLGTTTSFGINTKTGLLFLWERNIKELLKDDSHIDGLRKQAAKFLIITGVTLFLIPLLVFLIWYLFYRV